MSLRPGFYDIHQRIGDMNAGGILASLCFPQFVRFCGQVFAEAPDLAVSEVMVRA